MSVTETFFQFRNKMDISLSQLLLVVCSIILSVSFIVLILVKSCLYTMKPDTF